MNDDDYKRQFSNLEDAIRPLLHGHAPELLGAVLGDLVALWLAGHTPPLRVQLFADLISLIGRMIPINEMMLFGPDGHPYKDENDGNDSAHH